MAPKKLLKFPLSLLLLVLVNGIIHSLAQGYNNWYNGDENLRESLLPWDVDQLPNEPRTDFYRDLSSCLSALTRKCNKQLYYYIFRKRKINEGCCQKLLQMGRPCKDSLAWTLLHTEKYERYEGHINERSEAAFNKCSERVRSRDYGWY